MEEKLKKVEKLLEQALAEIQRLRAELAGRKTPPASELLKLKLIAELLKRGGEVSKEELHEIWKKMGKDPRGLGGFFKGKNPIMVETAKGTVSLTKEALRIAHEYKDYMKGYGIEFEEVNGHA
ncbi:hypothetical protein Theam_1794 (plasmid) [Thermovibrio ammonificans HB-1]|uniref:Uncharacterized protein n=1 Tax=Thermovibrio ammonificans (strain DSM 15698 / JCM 12110 / HB-1) TaxID=648996 RepID=E8T6S7_THEA1|nr:hypothetical protein [Thermovibrio ammonificans]ADU97750.1 hypothetical protein Theam_1794 [Thermovibrio ammonificans HB-1]